MVEHLKIQVNPVPGKAKPAQSSREAPCTVLLTCTDGGEQRTGFWGQFESLEVLKTELDGILT